MEEWSKPNKTGIVFGRSAPEKRERAAQFRQNMTPSEAKLWRFLRGSRLAGLHFRRQQVIDGFIADFYCYAAALIVETDGRVHDDHQEYDTARDNLFRLRGLCIVRVSNDNVTQNIVGVLQTIYQTAVESGLILPPFEPPVQETINDNQH